MSPCWKLFAGPLVVLAAQTVGCRIEGSPPPAAECTAPCTQDMQPYPDPDLAGEPAAADAGPTPDAGTR
jgi:hypothetical protein